MNTQLIYGFLKDLSANNNREWFNAHKAQYEQAKTEFDILTAALINRIGTFEEDVRGMQPSQCTYRIYRDLRFTQDKTPYKTHMGTYVNPKGKKSTHCGYYLHIEPDKCMLCVGSICWPTKILKALRESIVDNIDEYISIVENPDFKKYFPVIGSDWLKSAPAGFNKKYKYIKYLLPKDFGLNCQVPDSFFLENTDSLMDRVEKIFRQAKPFADFTNYTIDDYE